MLDGRGLPRPELFSSDSLHMSPAGYALWTKILKPEVAHRYDELTQK
jgi:lysophospholipase L1-like esterase